MRVLFLIGASGSGKTTLLKGVQALNEGKTHFLYFDGIIEQPGYGFADHSPQDWQRQATLEWCRRIAKLKGTAETVVMDGQTRYEFVREGCLQAGMDMAEMILVDCDDVTRIQRLRQRGQPELASAQMMSWAAWLRADAEKWGMRTFDTSGKTIQESIAELAKFLA